MHRRRVMADRITYVGLDVHKESIAVAVASGGLRGEVRQYGRVANTATALDRLLRKLGGAGVRLRFCYEDGVIPARRSGFAKLDGSCGATVHRCINRRTLHVLHWHRFRRRRARSASWTAKAKSCERPIPRSSHALSPVRGLPSSGSAWNRVVLRL